MTYENGLNSQLGQNMAYQFWGGNWGNACPRCGYCPHCGRGGHEFHPQYPASPTFYSNGIVPQLQAGTCTGPVIGDADCGTAENV